MPDEFEPCEGGCTCGEVRYRLHSKPLVVHGCHCTWCQRQTGTAFATNALIEADRVELLAGAVEATTVASPGGSGQRIARCPTCKVTVWSDYLVMTRGQPDVLYFIRVGTLDEPARFPPDVHIYTSTKQPWVRLPEGVPAYPEYYRSRDVWSPDSLERQTALRERIAEGAR